MLFSFRQRRNRGLFLADFPPFYFFRSIRFWVYFGRLCRLISTSSIQVLCSIWLALVLGSFCSQPLKIRLGFRLGLFNNSANLSGLFLLALSSFLVVQVINNFATLSGFCFRFLGSDFTGFILDFFRLISNKLNSICGANQGAFFQYCRRQ